MLPAEVIFFDPKGLFDPKRTHEIISARSFKYDHAVIPGSFGPLSDGEIKTFSRGDSYHRCDCCPGRGGG
jgi:aspartate kinase